MNFIVAPVIVATVVFGIYKLFELFARRRERMALIEKITEEGIGPLSNVNLNLPNLSRRFSFGALKGGCLLVGIGLGLLIGFFICATMFPNYFTEFRSWECRELSSIVYGSCMFLFGGIGLITAFVLEKKMDQNRDK